MIQAETFAKAASDRGFGLWTGVPCSYLTPFINYVIDDPSSRYVAAANEGDAVAIAAGASLAGERAIAMFQNSGLGNAVNPLSSLTYVFRIPILLIVTLRGEPGGPADEPQHALMGAITTRMLELMEIPWAYFPTDVAEVDAVLDRALGYFDLAERPFALVMRKGSVASHGLRSVPQQRPCQQAVARSVRVAPRSSRKDCLEAVQANTKSSDLILATTGYAGRELYACEDRPNQFYMVGSMGCIASVGLGLALTRPDRRVLVLDGDGSLLMRMGALSTIGYERPNNLMHIVLDNEQHESTGGQSTVSHSVDFCGIAAANGYPVVEQVEDAQALAERIRMRRNELTFLHLKIRPGVPEHLPRPKITPVEVAARLRGELGERPC
jgi:phosphonopyruvate decarboxylase